MTLCSSGENKRAEGGVGVKGERNWERGGGSGRGATCGWVAAVAGPTTTGAKAVGGVEQREHTCREGSGTVGIGLWAAVWRSWSSGFVPA
jgi:hypothetical protein